MRKSLVIRFSSLKNFGLYFGMLALSFISMVICIADIGKQQGYELLFLLPLSYGALLVIVNDVWDVVPQNIGLTMVIMLEFVRLVISPLLLVIGGYPENIKTNSAENTPYAILLMTYELLVIAFVIRGKRKYRVRKYQSIDDSIGFKRMRMIMIVVIMLTMGIIILVPEILSNYRSIVGLFTDPNYTNSEQTFLVDQFATTTRKRFLLATANYVLIVVRLLLPAYIIGVVNIKKIPLRSIITVMMIMTPFIFVAGAIARSLYYSLFLMIFYFTLKGIDLRQLDKPILLAIGFVFAFFIVRFSFSSNAESYWVLLSESLTSYFSGVNIVSGAFNLPRDIMTQLYYFARDIFGSFPYSTTIFRYNGFTIANYFNVLNGSRGQIPTTIGLGYYYFTAVFAPLYSAFFAYLAKKYGEIALKVNNQYYKLAYAYLSFVAALGICMYNIEIVLGAMIRVVLPIYVILRFAYRKERAEVTE